MKTANVRHDHFSRKSELTKELVHY